MHAKTVKATEGGGGTASANAQVKEGKSVKKRAKAVDETGDDDACAEEEKEAFFRQVWSIEESKLKRHWAIQTRPLLADGCSGVPT